MENNTVHRGCALADYIEPHAYGDVIRYQEIERITNEKRGTPRYYNAIAKAKSILTERGKMIVRIGGGDYQVGYPGDYAKEYAGQVKRANRRLKCGKKILDGAPVNDMTETERQTYNRVYDFNARLSASFSGSVTEVKRLTAKPHPMEAAVNGNSGA